jgi:curved DNA-binding protein CbpA
MIEATPSQESFYTVLDVPFDASEDELRKQYFAIVKTVHPDRLRPGSNAKNDEALERFHQIQTAWACLSVPTRRLLYDLRNFGTSSLASEAGEELHLKLDKLQKEQAAVDVANMQEILAKIIRREKAKSGIIIQRALYGDLRLSEDRLDEAGLIFIDESDLQGPFIDVTEPVQCLVEQHTIRINGGHQSSKADLKGFYNPSPLDKELELELYVLYEFKGKLHEVIVGDRDMLSCPRRAHAVAQPRGPYSSANVSRKLAMKEDGGSTKTLAARRGGLFWGSSTSSPGKARVISNPRKVLDRAVVAYRLASLRDSCVDNPSRREFAVVALCSGVTLALLTAWARWGKRTWIPCMRT